LLVTLATLATAVGGIAPVARAAAPLNSASVGVTVSDVHPSTALRSNAPRPVTFFLTLHNNTSRTLRDVSITAVRGDPIGSPARLRQVLASPAKRTGSLLPVPTVSGAPVTATLGPGQDAQVVYRTAAGIARGAPLCECADAIYPILFTATFATAAGASTVGAARTYLPVFGLTQPAKVDVGWLWPVLDRPHRLLATNSQDNVFTDDDLTNELAAGGRLDRLLTVVERVSPAVPMTLVVDPELLDEIQVMSTGHYVVRTAGATATVPGAGAAAAADWLGRLRAVLSASPDVEVALTAPADPDVESLTRQNLTWIPTPTPAAQQRIELALGGYPTRSDLSWPVGSTLSRAALGRLGAAGISTVVLNAGNLRGRTAAADVALSPLHASGFSGRAAVTDPTTDSLATTALQVDGQGMSAVPSLVSAVAAHAVEAPNASHYVLIAPSRLLDPDVDAATRAVLATADAFWSTPVTLATATRTITPTNRGTLHPAHLSGALPGAVIAMAKTVQDRLPDLEALFELERNGTVDSSAAIRLLGPLPLAVQRAESSSWRYFPGDGPAAARLVDAQVDHWIRGVRVVRPATGTYTLTSTSAPLPVTLANSLGVPVSVVLDVHTQDGLPGLSTDPPRTIIVDAHSTLQVKVMVHLERTGRLPVEVVLRTPTGRLALGEPLPPLTIHSTAIGTIGTVITVVAAVILALAMVLQAVRRLRTRRRTVHEPVVPPTPVGIS
jgi:hypothetical protein